MTYQGMTYKERCKKLNEYVRKELHRYKQTKDFTMDTVNDAFRHVYEVVDLMYIDATFKKPSVCVNWKELWENITYELTDGSFMSNTMGECNTLYLFSCIAAENVLLGIVNEFNERA